MNNIAGKKKSTKIPNQSRQELLSDSDLLALSRLDNIIPNQFSGRFRHENERRIEFLSRSLNRSSRREEDLLLDPMFLNRTIIFTDYMSSMNALLSNNRFIPSMMMNEVTPTVNTSLSDESIESLIRVHEARINANRANESTPTTSTSANEDPFSELLRKM
jgi:hypothetical protein